MSSTPVTPLPRRRLVDDVTDAYVDWREECVAVSDAYDGWTAAEATEAALAFAVYAAALDREERAAQVYAGVTRRLGDLVATDGEPETELAATGAGPR